MSGMSRDEHLKWAKDRALEYVEAGDMTNALASMMSDLPKHPELADHAGIMLGMMLAASGHLRSAHDMRNWIVGFN